MQDSKSILTSQNLAERYRVPVSTIRMLIDRIGVGTRLAHWRIVLATDLERLEAGLQALGYKIPPADPQIAMEQLIPEEAPQPAVVEDAPWT
jgi:hypothetical protein